MAEEPHPLAAVDVSSGAQPVIVALDKDLAAAFASPDVQRLLEEIIRRVVRHELQSSPQLDELVTAAQAAKLLGISKSAVWKAAERGSLPAVRHGRRVFFRRGDLLASAGRTTMT